jgi:hypothetical protein
LWTTTPAPAAAGPFLCFVDFDGATIELTSIHFSHGFVRVAGILESNESKATRSPRVSISNDFDFGDFSEPFKLPTKNVF